VVSVNAEIEHNLIVVQFKYSRQIFAEIVKLPRNFEKHEKYMK